MKMRPNIIMDSSLKGPEEASVAHESALKQERTSMAASLSRIAHELRTPLTTLRLALQLGRGRLQRGAAIELTTVERALSQVDQMTALLAQMTDAAALVGGTENLALQRIDLSDLLHQHTLRAAEAYPSRSVSFQTDGAAYVQGDRSGLDRVVANLLENAHRFSGSDSSIRVTMNATSTSNVVFTIADEGIGIPGSALESIFDMFHRAANAGTACAQGLGLGLYIARRIIDRHGGQIWADSELGRGSRFHVSLPVCLVD